MSDIPTRSTACAARRSDEASSLHLYDRARDRVLCVCVGGGMCVYMCVGCVILGCTGGGMRVCMCVCE